ncbi:hypothetical protein FHQ18_11515 [Deferribacter autotrophicus]|uniref:Uncharacterized protein n=1 Tax=Deferribacter autotrophicus TaxID=500465 RepID=A0A5A8F2S0_9BACT|nr:hypothetical protein [Deferribacter autotrophicus]KAA0257185.1 hypothetical protein FHQ18_11515 [Deferribacter autotrophicus]
MENSNNFIKGKNFIIGNNNIITHDPLFSIIKNTNNINDLFEKIEKHKTSLRKEKEHIINKIFLLLIPLLGFTTFLITAIISNATKLIFLFFILSLIPGVPISYFFKKLEKLSPKIKSTEELVIEIYKLVILDKIKEKEPTKEPL